MGRLHIPRTFYCLLFLLCGTAGKVSAQSTSTIIDTVILVGNERTKDYIILKQMILGAGDTIPSSELDSLLHRSELNILNTGLFLKANINIFENALGHINLIVDLHERWYIFPKPWLDIADRNINYWWYEQNHDLSRLDYGLDLIDYNMTGHADRLNVRLIFGFSTKFEVEYERPFLSPDSETGIGVFGMYAGNRQIYVETQNDQQVFVEEDDFMRTRIKAGVYVRHRQGTYIRHIGMLKFNDTRISEETRNLNPEYLGDSAIHQRFASISYTWINDQVDNRSYPLDGRYIRADVQKRGLGLLNASDSNSAKVDQIFISGQWNIYQPLGGKWYASAMLYGSQNLSAEYSYFLTESLGYCENFVRGYEYYVVDGQSIGLLRSNLRFKAVDKVLKSPLFKNSSFATIPVQAYLKVFADAGYVSDNQFTAGNSLRNTLLYSAGLGLDITTYYDWVFRFEGAVNALGEFGLYLHVGLDLNTYENCSLW